MRQFSVRCLCCCSWGQPSRHIVGGWWPPTGRCCAPASGGPPWGSASASAFAGCGFLLAVSHLGVAVSWSLWPTLRSALRALVPRFLVTLGVAIPVHVWSSQRVLAYSSAAPCSFVACSSTFFCGLLWAAPQRPSFCLVAPATPCGGHSLGAVFGERAVDMPALCHCHCRVISLNPAAVPPNLSCYSLSSGGPPWSSAFVGCLATPQTYEPPNLNSRSPKPEARNPKP